MHTARWGSGHRASPLVGVRSKKYLRDIRLQWLRRGARRRIFKVYTPREFDLRTRISKWGNSLAVRIPKAFVAEAGLEDGAAVDISVSGGQIIVTPLGREYGLAELVDDITEANRHTETDWGPPVGSEVW